MLSNTQIKNLKLLHQKKYRDQKKEIILEGHRLILQSLTIGAIIKKVWATRDYLTSIHSKEIKKILKEKNIIIDKTSAESIQRIGNSQNTQGIIALASYPTFDTVIKIPDFSIFLDNISDPGNMGTLLRTAHWFGIDSVFLSLECVDVFNSKVIRSAMGSHFSFRQLRMISFDEIFSKNNDLTVIAGDLKGVILDEFSIEREKKWIFVLGSEAHGISSSIDPFITHRVTIPRYGNMESLNVVAAESILLYHLTRLLQVEKN